MKLISWNVNGLRACLQKGFAESVAALDADVIALQETKLQSGQLRKLLALRTAQGIFRHGGVYPCAAAQRAVRHRRGGL